MRVTVFNDTRVDWPLHTGSERGVNGETRIPKRASVAFEVPDGHDVFVKVWGKMVMVRFAEEGAVPRTPPRPRRSRPLTDGERMNMEANIGLYGAVRDLQSRHRRRG